MIPPQMSLLALGFEGGWAATLITPSAQSEEIHRGGEREDDGKEHLHMCVRH